MNNYLKLFEKKYFLIYISLKYFLIYILLEYLNYIINQLIVTIY